MSEQSKIAHSKGRAVQSVGPHRRCDIVADFVLTGRAPHFDRGERECFGLALSDLRAMLGPAARVVDCGAFAGHWLACVVEALERPKAGITLSKSAGDRNNVRARDSRGREGETTAQFTHVAHDMLDPSWPLEAIGAGKTLALLTGGEFGFLGTRQAFTFLENASNALSEGDFVALALECPRDGAILEAIYEDFLRQFANSGLASGNGGGKIEGFDVRSFYDPLTTSIKFGACAVKPGSVSINGEVHAMKQGDWIDLGAVMLFDHVARREFHPDFSVNTHWASSDRSIALVLLQKR